MIVDMCGALEMHIKRQGNELGKEGHHTCNFPTLGFHSNIHFMARSSCYCVDKNLIQQNDHTQMLDIPYIH